MKILALITEGFGGLGGIARSNSDFLTALSSSGPEVSIVVLPRISKGVPDKLPPKVIWKKAPSGKLGYAFFALRTLLREGPFDLIFCGHLHLTPLAAILARIAKKPFWLQLHGIEAWHKPSKVLREAVKKARLVTAVSRHTRRKFLSWACVSPERVRVLPNTVGEQFQLGKKPDYLLERYGLKGKKVLFTLSRLSAKERYKGQDRVIGIMPELLQKNPNLVYVIAGEGDDRKRLETLAQEQNLNGTIRFVGEVKESELADHYRMADLFVMPSTQEGFGIVFLEAAACGLPVVGVNQDGSLDALLEGKVGRLVKQDDSEELRFAILESLGKNARSKAVKKFSASNFSNFIESLTKEKLHEDKGI